MLLKDREVWVSNYFYVDEREGLEKFLGLRVYLLVIVEKVEKRVLKREVGGYPVDEGAICERFYTKEWGRKWELTGGCLGGNEQLLKREINGLWRMEWGVEKGVEEGM